MCSHHRLLGCDAMFDAHRRSLGGKGDDSWCKLRYREDVEEVEEDEKEEEGEEEEEVEEEEEAESKEEVKKEGEENGNRRDR